MRPPLPLALPLALVITLTSCESTSKPSAPPLDEAASGPLAARTLDICQEQASTLLEMTRLYSGDVRGVRNACPGSDCETQAAASNASFGGVAAGHAAMLFACTPPTAEVCDDLDNDKDAAIDEDFPDKSLACSAGVGTCLARGFNVCSVDGSGTVCTAQPNAPGEEVCDYLDNDCDGNVDEDFPDRFAQCGAGIGACFRAGVLICSADGRGTMCTAEAGAPLTEICGDAIDNDCDGQTDETCGLP